MNLQHSAEDNQFAEEVKQFLATALTPEMRECIKQRPNGGLTRDLQLQWQKSLYEKGWFAVNWPVEYGGPGFTHSQRFILHREMAIAGAPGVMPFGVSMVAPVIMRFGTEEQKTKYLPDILASNVWWCQGYSEPGSGSDLASLGTKAEDKGDHYLVNGAKTWTTRAQDADMFFCLVRTSTESRRQLGISFLLIDMHSPGVEVKPIIMIDDHPAPHQEINTVFLTDVKVPKENLVGEEGQGWTCAKYLLEFERGNAYSPSLFSAIQHLRRIAKDTPAGPGMSVMDLEEIKLEMAQLEVETMAMQATELRILGSLNTGQNVGPESSMLKARGSEISQKVSELAVKMADYKSMPRQLVDFSNNEEGVVQNWAAVSAPQYFNNRKESIYAGSNEIQRNIIAKAVLGL